MTPAAQIAFQGPGVRALVFYLEMTLRSYKPVTLTDGGPRWAELHLIPMWSDGMSWRRRAPAMQRLPTPPAANRTGSHGISLASPQPPVGTQDCGAADVSPQSRAQTVKWGGASRPMPW